MKKITAILLILLLIIGCSACGSSKLDDAGFIKNMQKGLEARWKLSNASPDTYNSNAEKKQSFTNCVNAELNAIGDITAYTFEDEELKELAYKYLDALNSQLEGIKYIGSDDSKFTELYSKNGYYNRARVIYYLKENYNLNVSSTYADTFDEFYSAGRARLELDEVEKCMTSIISGDITLEALGGTNYECIIKNDSAYDLSGAQLEFNLYNDKDILVDTSTAYLNSWNAGSTTQCSLYVRNEFTRAEARLSLYSNSIYDYLRTEYFPIDYVNNMVINIQLRGSLPKTFDYFGSNGKKCTTCQVTDFSFEVGNWSNGTASVTLSISGKKTYDERGNNYSRGAKVGWKLYNDKGVVIDSGNFTSNQINVGESFANSTAYARNLAPGTYTLELLNVS